MTRATEATHIPLSEIPTTITFKVGKRNLEVDIVEAELAIEEIAQKEGISEREFFTELKKWIKKTHKVDITLSQAWMVFTSVRTGWDIAKKKLSVGLTSGFGLDSTPSK